MRSTHSVRRARSCCARRPWKNASTEHSRHKEPYHDDTMTRWRYLIVPGQSRITIPLTTDFTDRTDYFELDSAIRAIGVIRGSKRLTSTWNDPPISLGGPDSIGVPQAQEASVEPKWSRATSQQRIPHVAAPRNTWSRSDRDRVGATPKRSLDELAPMNATSRIEKSNRGGRRGVAEGFNPSANLRALGGKNHSDGPARSWTQIAGFGSNLEASVFDLRPRINRFRAAS